MKIGVMLIAESNIKVKNSVLRIVAIFEMIFTDFSFKYKKLALKIFAIIVPISAPYRPKHFVKTIISNMFSKPL